MPIGIQTTTHPRSTYEATSTVWEGRDLLRALLSKRRNQLKLPQDELAQRLGVRVRTVRNWFNGYTTVPYDRVEQLAGELRLGVQERQFVYQLAGYRGPPILDADLTDPALARYLGGYTASVKDLAEPAYVRDGAWRVLGANPAFERTLAPVTGGQSCVGHSLLRLILFHPEARRRLGRWRERWLMPVLSQFAFALLASPDHAELQGIRDTIAESPAMWAAYLNVIRYVEERSTEHLIHFDGAVLPMRGADGRERWMRVSLRAPLAWSHLGVQEVTLTPDRHHSQGAGAARES